MILGGKWWGLAGVRTDRHLLIFDVFGTCPGMLEDVGM